MVQEVEGEVEALLTLGIVYSTFYNFLYHLRIQPLHSRGSIFSHNILQMLFINSGSKRAPNFGTVAGEQKWP